MKTNNKRINIVSYTMLAPWLLVFILFTIIPILASFFLSFTYFNMLEPPKFTGLSNYLRLLLEDDVFLIALKNTVLLGLITGPIGYILSFIVAWFINDMSRFNRSWLTFLFYSPTVAGNVFFIWMFIFSSDSVGLLNSQLLEMGIIKEPVYWLTDPKTVIPVCIVVILWMSMGAGFLAFVAGFKSLNLELFEAGALDGIRNRWQEIWYITLPQMVPQLLIGAVLTVSGSFAVGYQVMALTGFPSTDYSAHTVVLHILDYGYIRIEMGYASAIAVILFVFMFLTWQVINKMISKIGNNS